MRSRRNLLVTIFAALCLTSVPGACGGDEREPTNAPLPEAWVRTDQTRGQRPSSMTLGDDPQAPAHAGADRGPDPQAVSNERALRADLQRLLEETWSTEPGFPRASQICRVEPRVVDLATRWRAVLLSAHGDRRATLDPLLRELGAALTALRETCASGDIEAEPEPVEGSFQGVAEETDALAREIDAL